MTKINVAQNCKLLEIIGAACLEIQQALNEHLETTTNTQYRADIEKDIVTLENLKLITIAVKKDIELELVGAMTLKINWH
jgi:hypothetical protein